MDLVAQTGADVDVNIDSSTTLDVDITAQTVGDISVDATGAGNIPIDITAQTGANVDVDVKASVTLDTDITAQTIGNLDVDLAAASVGTLDVDITAVTHGDLNIDLNAQTIDRVVIREHDGGIESSSYTGSNIEPGVTATLHSGSGKGSLRYVVWMVDAHTDAQLIRPEIYIDGTLMEPKKPIQDWYGWDIDAHTEPWKLLNYNVDGRCIFMAYFSKGLLFDSTIVFKARNGSGSTNQTVYCYWFYQKI